VRNKNQLDIFASTMKGRAAAAARTGLLEAVVDRTQDRPLMVSVGMGVDAIAATIALVRLGARIDLAIFSDTGGERPETYAYIEIFDAWLRKHAGIPLTVMRLIPPKAPYSTLEGELMANATIPGAALGPKSCSVKWKVKAIDSWIRGWNENGPRPAQDPWQPAIDCWERGDRVIRVIGFDAGAKDRRRGAIEGDESYQNFYALRELGMDRVDCANEILAAGLPLPIKSACFFCPFNKDDELRWLHHHHPDLFRRALVIEANAIPRLTAAEGMWRHTRVGDGRPGSWNAWARKEGLVVDDETDVDGFVLKPQDNPPLHYPDDEIGHLLAEQGSRRLAA
jgi:hypothetical protein